MSMAADKSPPFYSNVEKFAFPVAYTSPPCIFLTNPQVKSKIPVPSFWGIRKGKQKQLFAKS